MQANEDGVGNVGPQRRVAHADVVDRAFVSLARGVGRGAVVAVAAEHSVVDYVLRGEDVEAVAPLRMGDAANVVEPNAAALAHGTGVEHQSVNLDVAAAIDVAALIAALGACYAAPDDAHVVGVLNGKCAGEVAAGREIDGGA